ncbi:MAG TPA: MarR family transcriptional regulator [Candidatus Dormibacteraeota bacterium]|jgi:DNA-binding MarR family transcriptional regulator|nr:MarR family transcriptional regulator [Candidatus Dormibacteraeota bacterium]
MVKRKSKISPEAEAYRIGDLLHSTAIHLLRKVRAQDRSAGIGPAQLSALSVLVFGGPRSLKELAEAEQVRPPTMSRIVVGLERALLVRRKATDDKRRMLLEATARGTKILREGRRRRVEMLVRALQELSEVELQGAAAAAEFMRELVGRLGS